jgi:iron complex transport system ATP-binding protein
MHVAGVQIEASGLGRRVMDGTWLWRRATFSVHAGQVVGVLGRNGSGKTTLVRTLLGLLRPDEGHVRAVAAMGYVPQATQLALPFAVRDVVGMGRVRHVRLFGGLAPADVRAVEMALDHVGIAALAERSFLELSGGERQLVLIARALAADCEALILDEPFASLDLDNQRRTLALLGSLARRHDLSIVFSAHHPDHVFAIADAVVILTRGEVPVWGPVDAVLTATRLRHTYGVPVELLEIPHSGSTRRYAVPLL